MGLSLEKDGRCEEALAYYQKAQLLKRDDNAIQINIGNAYAAWTRIARQSRPTLRPYVAKSAICFIHIFLLAQKTGDQTNAASMLSILTSEFPSSPILFARKPT